MIFEHDQHDIAKNSNFGNFKQALQPTWDNYSYFSAGVRYPNGAELTPSVTQNV